MNKEKIQSFVKGKQFYYVLLAAFATLFVISSIVLSNTNKEEANKEMDLVDLNTPIEEESERLIEPISLEIEDEHNDEDEETETETEEETVEENIVENNDDILEKENDDVAEKNDTIIENEEEVVTTVAQSSEAIETKVDSQPIVTFNPESGMDWPIQGELLMPYSMEETIYFETLDQYKYNPAMTIKAMIGTEVKAAATGEVIEIAHKKDVGTTVTLKHNEEYKTVYGQLTDIQYNEGDIIEAGEIIGTVQTPTIFYVKEGSHLYFQVLKEDKPINPISLLN
ncbi:murein DD-endopeptidase MepM/ murein hydrolase activator NlpD [Natranaerovirga hydrolytica]|uniref:Murein DD-endopeptidase MepM/ murein hydrolase activator NlpD n=1 Tax=Natranaerovirga hydrolytica TaxID=680378 RepID=A0A4R1MML8_9FIRM|nr:M23 family metallopeptidase [Natranaerovirga hydrolytica]TCK93360.1 murein DD-endopeptidase MepM/ murein hydrolase activator NlpD [Natranaerovirga hydrolytica]